MKACHWKPSSSDCAPEQKTKRRARRLACRSAPPSSTHAEPHVARRIRRTHAQKEAHMPDNTTDNIFTGLKVVDFASFIAGPSAAVILSDFGADVIKVEPPSGDYWRHGHEIPPQPKAKDAYPWHLANRNKRGMTLDLNAPRAQHVLEKLVKRSDAPIV